MRVISGRPLCDFVGCSVCTPIKLYIHTTLGVFFLALAFSSLRKNLNTGGDSNAGIFKRLCCLQWG